MSGVAHMLRQMRLAACHVTGSGTLHLSHTTLVAESLCGMTVNLDGEPDLPVICDECLQHATTLGADVGYWFDDGVTPQLLLAA